jgi:integrase
LSRLLWQEAVVRYVREIAPQAVKPNTLKRYQVSFRQMMGTLDGLPVDRIDRRVIADLVSARKKSSATNSTINRDLTAVSAVLGACVEWGACEHNAARDFSRRLTREMREPIKAPSEEDVAKLVAICPGLFAGMVRFLHLTGCRQEEAASLTWDDIDLGGGTLTFRRTKTGKARTIRLDAETRALLEGLPRSLGTRHVFWHSGGVRYRNVASRFAALCKRAGVRFRCHDLRHGYAIRELRRGRDIYDLSQHLGHSSVKVTEMYLGHVPARNRAQIVPVENRGTS